MKPVTIPKPVEGFQTQTLDGEFVLLHPVRNILIHLNQTGALVWQLCDRLHSVDEIVEILSAIYPEACEQIAADVSEIVQELLQKGALEPE